MRKNCILLVAMALVVLAACSGEPSGVSQPSEVGSESDFEASGAEEILFPSDSGGAQDLFADGPQELWSELALPVCKPGDGCFLDACVTNLDCQSGWCVDHEGGKVCTRSCQDECPEGWTCQQVAESIPDVVWICASNNPFCAHDDPVPEECNGLDDDCDGDKDEDTCDDGNECTQDSCGGESGCANEPLTGLECKDSDPCTLADYCQDGECAGTPVLCDDNNPCTDDSCAEAGGCVFDPNQADCDDGDPCTVADECAEGGCAGFAVDCACQVDEDCAVLDDGDLCNGTLACDKSLLPYECVVDPGTLVTCEVPAGIDPTCLEATCDPGTGKCSVGPAHEGLACDDGNPCTLGEKCSAGACSAGIALNCNDGNPCTDDSCALEAGGCKNVPNTRQVRVRRVQGHAR